MWLTTASVATQSFVRRQKQESDVQTHHPVGMQLAGDGWRLHITPLLASRFERRNAEAR